MSRIAFIQDLLSSVFTRDDSPDADLDTRSLQTLCDSLLSERGEVSGNRLANSLLNRFVTSSEEEKLDFFQMLCTRFDIDVTQVKESALALAENNSIKQYANLFACVEPRRQELFRRLNRVPGATGALVDMRANLLTHLDENPELKRIDLDFQKLFRSWFNRGFLVIREIDWHTPANILEKLIEYEAVHEISSWEALRRRLAPADRKCFAFFHPTMLDEPLIFVEVALTKEAPSSIRDILTDKRESIPAQDASGAVFYSISNCQEGLAGVSFGNFLIKQVAQELSVQLPNLETFRTLSPVPGFMRWVNSEISITEEENLLGKLAVVKRIAAREIPQPNDEEQQILRELAAHYLVKQRRTDNQPLDPVARFHLGNGASLSSVMPLGDLYPKGLKQSAGVMVSYLYDLDNVLSNHENYAANREVIVSDDVNVLLGEKKKRSLRAAT